MNSFSFYFTHKNKRGNVGRVNVSVGHPDQILSKLRELVVDVLRLSTRCWQFKWSSTWLCCRRIKLPPAVTIGNATNWRKSSNLRVTAQNNNKVWILPTIVSPPPFEITARFCRGISTVWHKAFLMLSPWLVGLRKTAYGRFSFLIS